MKTKYRDRVKNRPKKETAITGHYFHVEYTLALPKRPDLVARYQHVLNTTFWRLFADENFVTLLQAESTTAIPLYLKPLFEEEKRRAHEID